MISFIIIIFSIWDARTNPFAGDFDAGAMIAIATMDIWLLYGIHTIIQLTTAP